jgi:hypothetical protein
MRLAVALAKAEVSASKRAARKVVPIGLCWSTHDVRVDPQQLQRGEFIAADVSIHGNMGGTLDLHVCERVTSDPSDLGIVKDAAANVLVGRVVEMRGSLLGLSLNPGYRLPEPDIECYDSPA